MSEKFEELNNALLKAIDKKEKLIKRIEEIEMPKLSDEQLKVIPLIELQEIVYELGIDEAYEINDRDDLIDYYEDWN